MSLIQTEHAEIGSLISREQTEKSRYQATTASTSASLRAATGQVTDACKSMGAEMRITALTTLVTSEFDLRIDRYTTRRKRFRRRMHRSAC